MNFDPSFQPNDEQKLEILKALSHHIKHLNAGPTKPKEELGVFPIPKQHVLRVLELADERTKKDTVRTTNALWRFIYSIMPAATDYRCSLDTSEATNPRIRLREYAPEPFIRIGNHGVVELFHVEPEHYAEVSALAETDGDDSTLMTRYNLWNRIEQLIPETLTPDTGEPKPNWKIHCGWNQITVFRQDKQEEADDNHDDE